MNDVSVPNMTTFAPTIGQSSGESDSDMTESFGAHVLGDIGSSYNFSMLPNETLNGTPWASKPAGFWNATDHWEYTFLDSAPSRDTSGPRLLSLYTDRTVQSTGTCITPPYNFSTNGELAVIQYLNINQTVLFPKLSLGLRSIFYLTTPVLVSGNSDKICDPGCSNVKVFEPRVGPPAAGSTISGSNSSYPHYFYDCNITVTARPQDLSPLQAAAAAQAIALSGQFHSEFSFTDTSDSSNQFVSYAFGLPFGKPQNNSAKGMASQLSRFAIGVVAAAAQTNPSMTIQGGVPTQGVRLQFDSFVGFNLILGLTGMLQLLLVFGTAFVVSRIVIPDEILLSHQDTIRKRFVLLS